MSKSGNKKITLLLLLTLIVDRNLGEKIYVCFRYNPNDTNE
jgi:hypothetical protein